MTSSIGTHVATLLMNKIRRVVSTFQFIIIDLTPNRFWYPNMVLQINADLTWRLSVCLLSVVILDSASLSRLFCYRDKCPWRH